MSDIVNKAEVQEIPSMLIHEHLSRIQRDLKAPKGQWNDYSSFHYRSCEDIVEAVKPLLGECALLITDEIVQVGDRYYVKATASITKGSDAISVTAFARETESKKGMDDAQITGATSSYARKYALNGLFAIDDTKDPDTKDNTQVESKTETREATEENTVVCEVCGKPATEKRGTTKGGKPYHGIFCSSEERSHTRWLWN